MNFAAKRGHLNIIKFLHENRTEGCTTDALDNAAIFGCIVIVKYLLMNRKEGFTENAIIESRKKGYNIISKLLETYRPTLLKSSNVFLTESTPEFIFPNLCVF